jgi:hypothetical protein
VLSSHELDRSLQLADSVITIAGGAVRPDPIIVPDPADGGTR